MTFAVAAHGGVGTKPEDGTGVEKAVARSFDGLKSGGRALETLVSGMKIMEDDPRYNAGTGSMATLDGEVEMDASIMTSEGEIGGVIAIKRVKNPISVAKLVMDTPHIMLAGLGAELFAREHGIREYEPITPKAQKRLKSVKKRIQLKKPHKWARAWKDYELPPYYRNIVDGETDTIGMVVMDQEGLIAVGNSTGGTSYQLRGRVGDTPQIGSGLWAGKKGGVAVTGIGETIVKNLASYRIYQRLEQGMSAREACEWGLGLITDEIPFGAIAIDENGGIGIAANKEMASHSLKGKEGKNES